MEKQEMEMKRKLEMETGNKWEQKTHQSLVQRFLHSMLSLTQVFYLAIVTGLAL